MQAKRYFQCSFFLPLIIPLLCGLIILVTATPEAVPNRSIFYLLGVVLWFSLPIGGIPYVIFLVGALIWSNRQTVLKIQQFTFLAPLIYGLFLGVVALIFLAREWSDLRDTMGFGLYGIVIGYLYVFPVNVVYWVLKRIRLVQTEEDFVESKFISLGLRDKQDG